MAIEEDKPDDASEAGGIEVDGAWTSKLRLTLPAEAARAHPGTHRDRAAGSDAVLDPALDVGLRQAEVAPEALEAGLQGLRGRPAVALEGAVADVTQLHGYELKRIMRTGTVASTDNRNWELLPQREPERRFSQSRAVALDMESATIAANGFRFRVPYGTLLCVSDKPLHGELKLPGMANQFYRERVDQHLRIGLRALERLRANRAEQLHSRKLRSFAEVAFQ